MNYTMSQYQLQATGKAGVLEGAHGTGTRGLS